MRTHFAPAKRADEKTLAEEIEIVSNNPVFDGFLQSASGLIAVLNRHRQVIAVNDSFMRMLGIRNPGESLGLRYGEALQCIHSHEEPDGCGTTKYCSTCGAAIAIVASIDEDRPAEKMCALTTRKGDVEYDIALSVKSQPITMADKRFILIFLQDVTLQQQRAALERAFLHDVNNMLSILVAGSELLVEKHPEDLCKNIFNASLRVKKEVAIQRCLLQNESYIYQPTWHEFTTEHITRELQSFFANHPAGRGRTIDFSTDDPVLPIRSDLSLISRVLCNMIINALEAAAENGVVRIWVEHDADMASFCVWNAEHIPDDIALRIFQRNFSTKKQAGRGVGTFSMKFFGEKILGGRVSFSTSVEKGTVFRFSVPL